MNFSKLDAFLEDMPLRGFPACELVVSHNGEKVYQRTVGFADSAKTRVASENDLYWIYSASKLVTCVAAMRLVEEGKLGLDDPVSKYIPEYGNVMIEDQDGTLRRPNGEMKIWHLFTMTGGLTYELRTPNIMGATNINSNTLEVVRAIALDPIKFEPGTRYLYSLCHDVLGAVCEVVVGKRFSEYLSEIIFEPLGLNNIGFYPTEEQKKRFSAMYKYNAANNTAKEIPCINELRQLVNFESGGGGLFSSAEDYLKFVTVLSLGGTSTDGYRLLKPETIAMMQKDLLCDEARVDMIGRNIHHGYGWGLGCRVHVNPTVSLSPSPVGEFGWDGAAGAYTFVDTENKIAAFYATHVMGARYGYAIVHPTIKRLIYEAIKES